MSQSSSSSSSSSDQQTSVYKAFMARFADPQKSHDSLKAEFQTLLAEEGQIWTNQKNFATSYKFQHLNRYSNILALDSTLFPPYSRDDAKYYFNANTLDARAQFPGFPYDFVAHQAPTEESFGAFWDSVLKSRAMGIVMLTGLVEGSRRKADMYWPGKKGESMNFGDKYDDLTVTNLGDEDAQHATAGSQNSSFGVIRTTFSVKSSKTANEDFRTVLFRYNDWPDHGVPRTTASIEYLVDEVDKRAQQILAAAPSNSCSSSATTPPPPLYVHCSAGVGRTGTFIASAIGRFLFRNIGLHQNKSQQQQQQGLVVKVFNPISSIFEIVRWLKHRRVGSVQQSEQYTFIHRMMIAEMEKICRAK